MGQFSMKIAPLNGSIPIGNQQACATLIFILIEPYTPILEANFVVIAVTASITTLSALLSYLVFAFLFLSITPIIGWSRTFSLIAAPPGAASAMVVRHFLTVPFVDGPVSFHFDVIYFFFAMTVLELQISAFCTFCLESALARRGFDLAKVDLSSRGNSGGGKGSDKPDSEPEASRIITTDPQFIVLQGQPFPVEQIIAISAHGKRLIVITTTGSNSVRASFSHALAQLDGVDGIRVHRSHWVSRRHIRCKHRDQLRNIYVELIDGSLLPVAQSYAQLVSNAPVASTLKSTD